MAATLGQAVGPAILRLRPDHTLSEIMSWTQAASLGILELLMALEEEFLGHGIDDDFTIGCDHRTFRELVEYLSRNRASRPPSLSLGR